MLILSVLIVLLILFGSGQDIKQTLKSLTKGFFTHLFLSPFYSLSTCAPCHRRAGWERTTHTTTMKNFTADIRQLEFLSWNEKQKNKEHETDHDKRAQNSRQSNADQISTEAAEIKSITTAKA
jgi:hypothetical protein